jgi:hypothetical protein
MMNDVSFHKAEWRPTDGITGLPCCLEFAEHCFSLFHMCFYALALCFFAFVFCFFPLALPRGLMMNESMPYTQQKEGWACIWWKKKEDDG